MRIFDGAVIPKESQKNVDNMTESEGRPWINEANADTQTQIIWHPQKICQLQSGKTYELCPKVSYKDQTHEHHVKIRAPKVDGYTYVGLMIDRGFRAKLIVGDAQNYSCSEEFCLIQ